MNRSHTTPSRAASCPGYSLVEVIIAMVVMSGLFIAAMNTVGAARATRSKNVDRIRGDMLAQDLMAEILQVDFAEPGSPQSFGRDGGENSGKRDLFDDVDDYHNWAAAPPQMRDGTLISDAADFERMVNVTVQNPAGPSEDSPTGIKRIDVTVLHRGKKVAEITAARTQAWVHPGAGIDGTGGLVDVGGLLP